MKLETFKWIYQRTSTPLILLLSVWLGFQAYYIENYNYFTVRVFFNNYLNLFFFISFILLSLFHTAIEVFHAIHDYFSDTSNEKLIKFTTKILYSIIFISLFIFILNSTFFK